MRLLKLWHIPLALVAVSASGQVVNPPVGGGGATLPANLTGVQTDGTGTASQQTSTSIVSAANAGTLSPAPFATGLIPALDASKITTGTFATDRVAAGCTGNPNQVIGSTGTGLICGPTIYGSQSFGDSYNAGTGPQFTGQTHTNMLSNWVASILPFDNKAVVATTTPTIVNSVFQSATPSPTYASFAQMDGGNNDRGADTCGRVAGTNCVKNYQASLEAMLSYWTLPSTTRVYASQATQSPAASWATNAYSLQLYDGSTNTVQQTAMQTSTSGAALSFAYPSTNNGWVDLYFLATSGATATFTVTPSTTGTPITDTRCSGTTTFTNGGCNGQAPLASAPQRISVAVTAGAAGTISVANTSANLLVVIAAKWYPSVWPSNTNYGVLENSSTLFDVEGVYSAAALASYNTFIAQMGTPQYLKFSDIRTVLAALPGGGAPASNTPNGGPAVAGGGAGGHPAPYAQQAMMMTDAGVLASTGVLRPGSGAMATGNSGAIYGPLNIYAGAPSNLGNTEANSYNIMNFRNTPAGATVFCGNNVGVNCGIRTAGAGVTKPDGTTTAYMGIFGTTSSYPDVCFEPYVATFFATPTTATPKACVKLATGIFTFPQVVFSGTAPTIAAGTAAGTGATATITGANMAGRITINTGTSTTASATLATITFGGTVPIAPQGCTLQAVGTNANGQVAMVAPGGYPTTTGWTIAVAGAPVPASTTYTYSYTCQ